MESLADQLLLEPDSLGDVPGVQHDSTDVAVAPQVGETRLQMPPGTEIVPKPNHKLVWTPAIDGRLEPSTLVGIEGFENPVPQELALRAAEQLGHRPADVTAAVAAEDEDEVGRCRDQAPEVGGLP